MCILLKLDYAKFGVSNLFFFSKVIEEKPLGDRLDAPPPSLGKGRVKNTKVRYANQTSIINTKGV